MTFVIISFGIIIYWHWSISWGLIFVSQAWRFSWSYINCMSFGLKINSMPSSLYITMHDEYLQISKRQRNGLILISTLNSIKESLCNPECTLVLMCHICTETIFGIWFFSFIFWSCSITLFINSWSLNVSFRYKFRRSSLRYQSILILFMGRWLWLWFDSFLWCLPFLRCF